MSPDVERDLNVDVARPKTARSCAGAVVSWTARPSSIAAHGPTGTLHSKRLVRTRLLGQPAGTRMIQDRRET
jgi:hypothetical protein